MRRTLLTTAAALVTATALAAPAHADREPFPHDFHHNMGYCAPFLAQLRLPDGGAVRPFINHVIQDLTTGQTFEGQTTTGDLYSDRARSTTDMTCAARP